MISASESEWLGNGELDGFVWSPQVLDEDDPGVYGTGLVVGENGEMALITASGDEATYRRITDTEASSLALMIQAVLG